MDIISTAQFFKFFAALVFVLCLMGILALVMKRFHQGANLSPLAKRRLKIVEILPIDARRKLAIVRRDNTEHLLILGTNTETVVESGFQSPQNDVVSLTEQQKAA